MASVAAGVTIGEGRDGSRRGVMNSASVVAVTTAWFRSRETNKGSSGRLGRDKSSEEAKVVTECAGWAELVVARGEGDGKQRGCWTSCCELR